MEYNKNQNGFCELTSSEMENIDGGLVGTLIGIGIFCVGVAIGIGWAKSE